MQRVATVAVVLPLFLAAVYLLPPSGWSGAMLVLMGLGAWEWARLSGLGGAGAGAYVLALAVVAVGVDRLPWSAAVPTTLGSSLVLWLVVAPLLLARHIHPARPAVRCAIGAVVLLPTWLAIVRLREIGPTFLLVVLGVIWLSDIAAYFAGRRFGKRRLAPAISPGKTWEGVLGAAAAVAAYALVVPTLFSGVPGAAADWLEHAGWLAVPVALGLAALGIEGDLFESWVKRGAGVKDSGTLLPGHGGVLDRIDALTAALPAAALLAGFLPA